MKPFRVKNRPWVTAAIGSLVIVTVVGLLTIRLSRPSNLDNYHLEIVQWGIDHYLEHYGHFPHSSISQNGKPPYSWRVAILPYINREDLFKQYNFNEPWDSPANRRLLEMTPPEFLSSSSRDGRLTNVVAVVDEHSVFSAARDIRDSDVTDPQAHTITVVVIPNADIPWTEPRDLSFAQFVAIIRNTQNRASSGRVRFITNWAYSHGEFSGNEPDELLRALITIDGCDDATAFFRQKQ